VKFVAAHDSLGGVAPRTTKAMISKRRGELKAIQRRHSDRIEKRNRADGALRDAVQNFLSK
jgi:hypothetical protein